MANAGGTVRLCSSNLTAISRRLGLDLCLGAGTVSTLPAAHPGPAYGPDSARPRTEHPPHKSARAS